MITEINQAEMISKIRIHLLECLQGTEYAISNQRNISKLWRDRLETETELLEEQIACLDRYTEIEKELAELRRPETPEKVKYFVRIHNKPELPVTDFYIAGGLERARAAAIDLESRFDAPASVRTLGGDWVPDYCRKNDGDCKACELAIPGGFDCEMAPLEDRAEGTAEERADLPF